MDGITVGIIIGGLSLIATCAFGALMYFKQFPKRSVMYSVSSSPLLNARDEGLEVRFHGEVLSAPYVVNFHVTSRSRADIPSASFDAGESLVFDFGQPLYGSASQDTSILSELSGSQVEFRPQIIRRGSTVTLLFITDGNPREPRMKSPLIDVKVWPSVPNSRYQGTLIRSLFQTFATGFAALALAAGIASMFLH